MTELEELERNVKALTAERNRQVSQARETIERANRWFDEKALPLMRRINELESEQKPSKQKPRRLKVHLSDYDPDWSDEDIEHFRRLQATLVTRN